VCSATRPATGRPFFNPPTTNGVHLALVADDRVRSGLSGLCPRDKNTRDIFETYHERGSLCGAIS
jgi:hypothetical protein